MSTFAPLRARPHCHSTARERAVSRCIASRTKLISLYHATHALPSASIHQPTTIASTGLLVVLAVARLDVLGQSCAPCAQTLERMSFHCFCTNHVSVSCYIQRQTTYAVVVAVPPVVRRRVKTNVQGERARKNCADTVTVSALYLQRTRPSYAAQMCSGRSSRPTWWPWVRSSRRSGPNRHHVKSGDRGLRRYAAAMLGSEPVLLAYLSDGAPPVLLNHCISVCTPTYLGKFSLFARSLSVVLRLEANTGHLGHVGGWRRHVARLGTQIVAQWGRRVCSCVRLRT